MADIKRNNFHDAVRTARYRSIRSGFTQTLSPLLTPILRKAHPVARYHVKEDVKRVQQYEIILIENNPDVTSLLWCLRQYEGIVRDAQLHAVREFEGLYPVRRRTEPDRCELQLLSGRKRLVLSPLETGINKELNRFVCEQKNPLWT